MASPQKENCFTQIPNELIEAFQRLHLSGNQGQILWTIIRKTYGWHKDVASISLTTFEECTGKDRRNLKRSLDAMVKKKIITRDNSGFITKYGIQKNYTKWQTSVEINTSVKNNTRTSVNNDTETSVKSDTHKRKKKIKYSPNSNEIRMAELLFSFILKRYPAHRKPDMQIWALHIDRMIRCDSRSVENIEKIIKWCQEDEFWQNNILSTASLRKQYDTLWLKAGLNGKHKIKRYDEQGF
ncbi:MAG: replication protein [Candidatus Scalindua sp.]